MSMTDAALKRLLMERLHAEPVAASTPPLSDYDLNPDWDPRKGQSVSGVRAKLKDAAVLVPIVERDQLMVLLTRRADHLPSHPGQVSFPGGRVQHEDIGPADTALRETEEEIGLARAHVRVTGYLDPYETGTGYAITPVVGFVAPPFSLTVNASEVAEAFEVPLTFLMDSTNHQRHSSVWQGKERTYYAMPYGPHYIWGATAAMLVALKRRLMPFDGMP